jgi:hypothetical protein
VKYWAREDEGGQRDPTDLSKRGRSFPDIAAAVWKVLIEQPSGSTKFIAAHLRTSREFVKKTLVHIWE